MDATLSHHDLTALGEQSIARSASISRATAIGLTLIVLAGLVLRFAGLDAKPLWEDEAWTFHTATAPKGALAVSGLDPHPLSFYMFYRALPDWFLTSDWAFRLPSAVFSALALILFVKLMRLATADGTLLLLAVALFAFLPINIRYAFEARAYAMAQCMAVAVLVAYLAALRRASTGRLILLVAAVALSSHLDGFGLAAPFAVFLHALVGLRRDRSARRQAIATLFGVLLAAPYYIFRVKYFADHPGVHAIGESSNLVTALLSRVVELSPFGVGADQFPRDWRMIVYALAIVCIGIVLLAARTATWWHTTTASRPLFAALAIATPVVYLVMSGVLNSNLIHKKYLLVTTVALTPLFAAGFLSLAGRVRRPAALCLAVVTLCVSLQVLLSPGDRADWRSLYGQMRKEMQPGDLFVQEREENYPDYAFGPLRAYAWRDGRAIAASRLIEYAMPSGRRNVAITPDRNADWESQAERKQLVKKLEVTGASARVWTLSTDWIAQGRTLDLSSRGRAVANYSARGVRATLWLAGGGL